MNTGKTNVGGAFISYGNQSPAVDAIPLTWAVGNRRYYVGAPSSDIVAWECTVAGTPGTWRQLGGLVKEVYRRFHFTQGSPGTESDLSGEANFHVIRTNDAATAIAGEPGHPGIWRLGSASANNQSNAISNNSLNEVAFGGVDHFYQDRFRIPIQSNGTNTQTVRGGWIADRTVALGVGVYWYMHPTTGHIIYRCQDAVGNTEVDTGVVYTDNTWLDVYASVSAAGIASFFTVGTGFGAVASATISTNIPGTPVGVLALGLIRTAGTASRPCDIDYCEAFILH